MRFLIGGFMLMSAVIMSGCAAPLPKIAYDKPTSVTSQRLGTILLTSGVVEGSTASSTIPAGGIFVTIPSARSPAWVNFNLKDQEIFANSLAEELNRLGIMRIAMPPSPDAPLANVQFRIIFERTTKNPNADYRLQVKLEILTPGANQVKSYDIRSFDGESGWAKFNVTPPTGKKMAAQKLLDAMIPDIEAFVAQSTSAS